MQFPKIANFLLPTDLEKSFSCLVSRGLKNPLIKIIRGLLQSVGKLEMPSVGRGLSVGQIF